MPAVAETAAVEQIVAAEVDHFLAWLRGSDVAPTVAALRTRAEDVVASELRKLYSRRSEFTEEQRGDVSRTLHRVVQQLLHSPTVRVRQLAAEPGGDQYAALLRELFDLDLEQFNDLVAQAPIGAEGVSMLPFLNGERVPALPHATGSLLGLTMTNLTQANLCRAVLEGTTFGLRYGLDLLRQNGLQSRSICLIGGGSKSPVWRQIVADIMNTPVICTEQSEAAALGAAIQAAWCKSWENGHEDSLEDLCERCVKLDTASETLPIADNVAACQQAYERYQQHVATL